MPLLPTTITAGRFVADEGVDVHQAEARGTVAEQQHDLAVGACHPSGGRVAEAVAEATVRARVEPAAGLLHLDELAGVRREVAAVTDHHRVIGQTLAELAVDAARLDRRRVGAEQFGIRCSPALLGGAQFGDPVLVVDARSRVWFASARRTSMLSPDTVGTLT